MADSEVINGYDIDELARTLYDARAHRARPVTDEEWERHARQFPATHRMLLEDARQLAEEDD